MDETRAEARAGGRGGRFSRGAAGGRGGAWLARALAAGTAVALLTGCGGPGVATEEDTRPPGEGVANVQPDLDRWLEGTSVAPDMSDSPEPAQDKRVMLISCGQSTASCERGVRGARDAADAIGWQSTVYDTQGDYGSAGNAIRQAIAQNMDGIFIYFIDCSYMKQPLQEAKDAGIPVVQAEGVDCNEASDDAADEEPMFSHSVSYVEGPLLKWIEDFGAASAAYLIAETRGRGDMLFIGDNAAVGTQHVYEGFDREMEKCPDCTSEIIQYSFGQLYEEGVSEDLQQKLLQRPDVNAVGVAYEGILLSGVSSAISVMQRGGLDYTLTGGEGSAAGMDLVRDGVVTAGPGLDNEWEGWSGIDNLNRIMQGAPTSSSGIGIEVYDAEHGLPESGPFVSKIDYQAVYREAWGVG